MDSDFRETANQLQHVAKHKHDAEYINCVDLNPIQHLWDELEH